MSRRKFQKNLLLVFCTTKKKSPGFSIESEGTNLSNFVFGKELM